MLIVICLALLSASVSSESFFEIGAGGSRLALDIVSKRGETFADDTSAANFSIGAYRQSTENSAWGGVIEYTVPTARDDLPGNGEILGLRPINFLYYIGGSASIEFYGGAAQYHWRKTANGYYFGSNFRYEFYGNRLGLGLDVKYYQDLAIDLPEVGDEIVDGFNTGLKLFYRFK